MSEHFGPCTITHIIDLTSSTVQITNDITHILFWGQYFKFHDWLKYNWASNLRCFSKSKLSCRFKRQ